MEKIGIRRDWIQQTLASTRSRLTSRVPASLSAGLSLAHITLESSLFYPRRNFFIADKILVRDLLNADRSPRNLLNRGIGIDHLYGNPSRYFPLFPVHHSFILSFHQSIDWVIDLLWSGLLTINVLVKGKWHAISYSFIDRWRVLQLSIEGTKIGLLLRSGQQVWYLWVTIALELYYFSSCGSVLEWNSWPYSLV